MPGRLFVLSQRLRVQLPLGRQLGDEIFVVQRQGEPLRQSLRDLMTAAAHLSAQGNDQLLHGKPSFLSLSFPPLWQRRGEKAM